MSLIVCKREVYEGQNIRLLVLDRQGACAFTSAEPYVVVSITTPGDRWPPPFQDDENRRGVLSLRFHDVQPEQRVHGMPMDERQAHRVADFAWAAQDAGHLVVVHCDAGISRSAGVAAALAHWFDGPEGQAWHEARYAPNPHVMRLVREAAYRLDRPPLCTNCGERLAEGIQPRGKIGMHPWCLPCRNADMLRRVNERRKAPTTEA